MLGAASRRLIVSMHSFTQAGRACRGPGTVGMLWDRDPRLACHCSTACAPSPDIEVGENEPYSGQLEGDYAVAARHARGLANALIEVRQDLILAPGGQARMGGRLADALAQ